jgi:hypothetical protein
MNVAELKLELYRQIDKIDDTNLQKLSTIVKEMLPQSNPKPRTRGIVGSMKGFVTYVSRDFDEPLEDYKDYM